jgi:hypothetical protein
VLLLNTWLLLGVPVTVVIIDACAAIWIPSGACCELPNPLGAGAALVASELATLRDDICRAWEVNRGLATSRPPLTTPAADAAVAASAALPKHEAPTLLLLVAAP